MKLKPHQCKAVQFMVDHDRAALFLDPGLGKTRATLEFLEFVKLKEGSVRADIIAPLMVMRGVWAQEIKKWGYDLSIHFAHGPNACVDPEADINITTYDSVRVLEESKSNILILDESSYVKNHATLRFKSIRGGKTKDKTKMPGILSKYKKRYILTGSPCGSGLINLWSQLYILDEGDTLGKFITHYRNKYFHQKPFSPFKWHLNPGAEQTIAGLVAPISLRMNALDHLGMANLFYNDIIVRLPAQAQEMYNALRDDFVLDLEKGVVTSANAAVAANKLRQLAGGSVYDTAGNVFHIHKEKIKALEGLVNELQGTPALVAYQYHHELDMINSMLGYEAPAINGDTTAKELASTLSNWAHGDTPVLCVHPAACAHGLNLQTGHVLIWYSLTWSLELYMQTIRRLWRQGQTHPVTVHRIIAENTIDETVAEVLAERNKLQEDVLSSIGSFSDALFERIKRRVNI